MVMNLSLRLFCENLKATKPPYNCPVENCGKRYMSYAGIRYHLYHFDHEQAVDSQLSALAHPSSPHASDGKHVRDQWHHSQIHTSLVFPEFLQSCAKDALSPTESKQVVEFNINGKLYQISRCEPLDIIDKRSQSLPHSCLLHVDKGVSKDGNDALALKMPVAEFRILEEYVRPAKRPTLRQMAYYRYVEKTAEELNEEVEYDMDEEDYAWLELINLDRKEQSISEVSNATFELVMDRFEKEAFFLSQSPSKKDRLSSSSVDEDAVCVICMDGECQNSNVILFCDMCNLAVHQECYGVPYIPEGQWLCRRCLQSPSRAVDCCLCPNKGGAFKQTSDGRWAHVVCALWIPEVCFANTVFLEPIDSIENIPSARWRLMCYICRQRQTGASIQCHRPSCYTAFHVTCAQQAGLYMKIIPVTETDANGISVTNVCKTAFCDVHSPLDISLYQPMINHSFGSDDMNGEDSKSATTPAEAKAISREKMKQTRKILAEKRRSAPAISIPVLSNDTLMQIADRVNIKNKEDFLSRLKAYWTLKRQSRNGVPLLRRLQANHLTKNKDQLILISKESGEMPKKKPPKNSDNVKQHSSDSKTLYDTSVSDETASNSEESNSDSKGFAVKLVDSKLDTNLKELKELKMEVKPKITLPSEVGSEAAAAMSPSDNCFGVRRSTRGFSGGKGSPFQLVKYRDMIFDGKVKVEEDSYKQVGCEENVVEEKQNKEKDIISLKIKIPKSVKWKRKQADYPMDHVSQAANSEDKNGETVVKEERRLRKKRKLEGDFADVIEEELLIDIENTSALEVEQAEEGRNILNKAEIGKGLRTRRKRMVEPGDVSSALESLEVPSESPETSTEKRTPKKCKEHSDTSDLPVKKKRRDGNDGANVKSLANSGCVIKTPKNKEKEDITEPGMESHEELKQLQRLRQNLERVRLLVELIQKREKMKLLELQLLEKIVKLRLMPFAQLLHQTLDRLQQKDTRCFFAKPVSTDDVPDYLDHIHYPMDFFTMRLKIEAHQYQTVGDFKSDFDLTISNCMTYNAKGTIYYSAAVRLRDQGQSIMEDAQKTEATVGYDPDTGLHLLDRPQQNGLTISENQNSEFRFSETQKNLPLEEQLKLLLDEFDAAENTSFSRRSRTLCHLRKEIAKVRKQLVALQSNCFASCIEHETTFLPVVTRCMVSQMSTVDSSPRLTRSASARKTDLRHDMCESLVPCCTSIPLQTVTQEVNDAKENKESTEKPDDSFKMKRKDLCQTDLKVIPIHSSIQVTHAAEKCGRKEILNAHENSHTSESNAMNAVSEHLPISPMNLVSSSSVFDSEVKNWYPERVSMNSMEAGYEQPIPMEQQSILPMKQRPLVDLTHFEQPLLQPWTALALTETSPLVQLASIKPVVTETLSPQSLLIAPVVSAQSESDTSVLEPMLLEQSGVLESANRRKEAAEGLLEGLIEDVEITSALSISVQGMESDVEQRPMSPMAETISVIRLEPGYMMNSSEETMSKQCRGHYQSVDLERRKHLEDKRAVREAAEDSFDYLEPIEMERTSITEVALPVVTELDSSESLHLHVGEKSTHNKSVSLEIKDVFSNKSPGCLIDAPASKSITEAMQGNAGNQTNDQLSANIAVDRESEGYQSSVVCHPILQPPNSGPSSPDSESLEFTSANFRQEHCDKPNTNFS